MIIVFLWFSTGSLFNDNKQNLDFKLANDTLVEGSEFLAFCDAVLSSSVIPF